MHIDPFIYLFIHSLNHSLTQRALGYLLLISRTYALTVKACRVIHKLHG